MAKKKAIPPPGAIEPAPKKLDGGPDDYEASSAYDSITRANEHLQDPAMMKRVKAHAGRKHKAVLGLHKIMGMGMEDIGEPKPDSEGPKDIADLKKLALSKAKTGMRSM